jgi:hypothetical protein
VNGGSGSGNQGGMTNGRLRYVGVLFAVAFVFVFGSTTGLAAEPLRVELDPTAAAFSEGEVRVAIEKELGRPVTGKDPTVPSDVHVAVADGNLVVRVKQGNHVVERSVPLPANLADVPLTVSLIVGNLARDQSVGLTPPPATPRAEPEKAPAPSRPKAHPAREETSPHLAPFPDEARFRSHWFGIHVAQDLAIVGGNNVCDPNVGQSNVNYACFYEGTTDQPFVHTPYPYRDGIKQGLVIATQRLLLSYDHALFPFLTVGGRAGYAFGGGPPAGQQVQKVGDVVPERATGTGGVPFFPYHLEVKIAYWWAPLTNRLLRSYVHATVGTAQVDAKVSVPEYDCAKAGMPDKNPEQADSQSRIFTDASGSTYTPPEQCKLGKGYYNYRYYEPTRVDAWKKMGQLFVSLGAGGMLAITDQLGVVLNLNAMLMLPAPGFVLEPSVGLQVGL